MRGSCLPHAQFSLQYLKFSLRYTIGNMFGMFLFAFWVIRALKCEAVKFLKFKLAGVPVRPIEYLGVPILIIAHAPCMCMRNMHAHCDVTWFASPAFMFHSCHVEIRWHDVIGLCIVGTPCHHGSYHMEMK